jgi:nitroreductase
MLKKTLIEIYYALKDAKKTYSVLKDEKYYEARLSASIFRLVHSIEKGLSIENPRLGFGTAKISSLVSLIDKYTALKEKNMLCVYAACDALENYFKFHDEQGYSSQEFEKNRKEYNIIMHLRSAEKKDEIFGGVQTFSSSELDFNIMDIETLFGTRHSIRQFANSKVNLEDVKKAIKLAQHAPSACNRQAVRVYAIDSKKYTTDMRTNLEGIGGFTEDVDMFLLITGKLSAYDEFEYKQFVVSAGIFAGYLSLALHAYKIGACLIQRSIRDSKQWQEFREKNNIPGDEQLVVMVGIGVLKEETIVPISKRYHVHDVFRVL